MKKLILILAVLFFCTTSVQATWVILINNLGKRIWIKGDFADHESAARVAWAKECTIVYDQATAASFTLSARSLEDEKINYIAYDPRAKDSIYIYYVTHDGPKGREVRHIVYAELGERSSVASTAETVDLTCVFQGDDDASTVCSDTDLLSTASVSEHEPG